LEKLLIQKNKTEQASWFDLHVAKIFDSNIFKKISSSPFALFYLGIPPKQYMALCDGQPENMAQVLKERAKHLATVERIDRNYFAWQAFGRKYDHSNQENLPQYLQLSNFNVLKNNISKLSIEQNNIVEQFSKYEIDGYTVNGKLTLGENIADIGGVQISYNAYMKYLKVHPEYDKIIDGLTPSQRFFINYAKIWKNKSRIEDTKIRIITDPHSPNIFRVNGVLRNIDAFYKAFDISKNDKMYLDEAERSKIWSK
jgi:hypothetical protein